MSARVRRDLAWLVNSTDTALILSSSRRMKVLHHIPKPSSFTPGRWRFMSKSVWQTRQSSAGRLSGKDFSSPEVRRAAKLIYQTSGKISVLIRSRSSFEQSKNERLLYEYLQASGMDVRWLSTSVKKWFCRGFDTAGEFSFASPVHSSPLQIMVAAFSPLELPVTSY